MITATLSAQSTVSVKNYNSALKRHLRKVVRGMIWNAANSGAQASRNEIIRGVDRPTAFTNNASGRLVASSGAKHGGKVFIKPIQAEYLRYIIEGGTSNAKKPIPFKTIENKYGNMPRGFTRRAGITGAKINGKSFIIKKNGKRSVIVGIWNSRRRYKKKINWKPVVDRAVRTSLQRDATRISLGGY